MEEKDLKIIKKSLEDLIKAMGFKAEVELNAEYKNEQGNLICDIKTDDHSDFLIGQYGANLQALQHIARLIVRKKTDNKIKFALDINSYRQQKNKLIIEQAVSAAQKVIKEKKAVIMRPMTPYERRLVHIELANNEQVATSSIGEGENRKVIIRPT